MTTYIISGIIVFINVISFSLMGIDKHKAIHNKYRIPEKTLFLLGFLMGAYGFAYGMHVFRHKTKKLSFIIGSKVFLLMQTALIIYILIQPHSIEEIFHQL